MSDTSRPIIYDSSYHRHPEFTEIKELFRYRFLVAQLARRDILTRYKRSVFGVAWTMINPLGMMLVMTIAFSQLFSSIEGYPVYIFSGLIVWSFFSQTTTAAMVNLVWGGSLLKRIYIPRTSFAISAVITGVINLIISLVPLVIIALITQYQLSLTFLLFPLPVLLIMAFSLGIGLLLSTMAIYFPDVAEMYQIIIMAWMYLTPIFYPESILPEPVYWLVTHLNPMYHILKLFRAIIYEGRLPYWSEIWPATLVSIVTLIIGWVIFSRKSDEFGYRI